ncbi:PIR protein [Plasmodium yoelii yoelii]|uniref:PIR protein n=1 Tax=Plasmodium yoelii yoelii TaxID=73239 RepID=A0AAE9WNI3_PLAYO|nr:PIR protein [Plasmodium yoelii yoelii]
MDNHLCRRFGHLRSIYPDELNASPYSTFDNNRGIKSYCHNVDSGNSKECKTEPDKINAACLWLVEQIIINKIDNLSNEKFKMIIIYIMIWLSHMLELKNVTEFKNINAFYTKYTKNNIHYTNCKENNDDCSSSLKNKTGYNNFKEFIEANECLMNIGIKDMSNFYAPFKSLCNIYTEFNANKPDCEKYLKIAKEFVAKYNELNNVSDIGEDSPYYQVLFTLSTDYDNYKNYCTSKGVDCNDFPSLPMIKTKKNSVKSSERTSVQDSGQTLVQISEATSPRISYKYSLFGFRKRFQKQHLRKKLKK